MTTFANSILARRCIVPAITAAGKDLRTTSFLGNDCAGTTVTVASLQLIRGLTGHEFEVNALKTPSSVAVDIAAAVHCPRQAVRDAECGIGAFDCGATAP